MNDNSCCLFTLHVGQWIDAVLHRSIGHLSLGGGVSMSRVGGDSGDSPLIEAWPVAPVEVEEPQTAVCCLGSFDLLERSPQP